MPGPRSTNELELAVRTALVRSVPDSFYRSSLCKGQRLRPDVERARIQHFHYRKALVRAGVEVVVVPGDVTLPDAPFIEDTAVLLGGRHALVGRPGANLRSQEPEGVVAYLESYRTLDVLPQGAILDGGDVLLVRDTLYVGLTERTNETALGFLERLGDLRGFRVQPVPVVGSAPLRNLVSYLGNNLLLHAAGKAHREHFGDLDLVCAPEAHGANVLAINGVLIAAAEASRTIDALERRGLRVEPVELSEFLKAGGGPTSLALRVA